MYHSCLSIKGENNQVEKVVTIGGKTTGNLLTNTVEVLKVEKMQFEYGPALPKFVEKFSALIINSENSHGMIYVLGGNELHKGSLSSIYVISAEILSNQTWMHIGDMSRTRSRFQTFSLPDNFSLQC